MRKVVKYLIAVSVVCVTVVMARPSNSQVADFDRIQLVVAGEQVQPLTVSDGYYPTFAALDKYVSLEGTNIVARDSEGNKLWSAEAPDGERALLLAQTERYLVATGVPRDGGDRFYQYEWPNEAWVLDLDDGNIVRTLHAPSATGNQFGVIVDVIAKDDRIVVLSSIVEKHDSNPRRTIVANLLTCYQIDKDEPLWTKRMDPHGEIDVAYRYLLANRFQSPFYDEASPLTWIGEDLIVCSGSTEPIQRVSIDDGETDWSVDRIWEFHRAFIGPSAFMHYVARFGEMAWREEDHDDALLEERKRFDETYDCSLIAGPAVVEFENPEIQYTPTGRKYSIFVIVSKDHKTYTWPDITQEAVLYELTGDGRVISMATLPRLPLGSEFHVTGDSVVWACQSNSALRAVKNDYGSDRGRRDPLTKISWYRQFDELDHKAWLTTFPAGDTTAFSDRFLYRPAGGGYVETQGDKQYRFAISAISLDTGERKTMTLMLEHDKEIEVPTSIYSSAGDTPYGPAPYGLTAMDIVGNRLRIVITSETKSTTATFDLSAIEDALTGTQTSVQQ